MFFQYLFLVARETVLAEPSQSLGVPVPSERRHSQENSRSPKSGAGTSRRQRSTPHLSAMHQSCRNEQTIFVAVLMMQADFISDFRNLHEAVAGGPGFEPRLTESESVVLPLNYPPTEALMCFAMLVKTSRGRSLAKRGLFDKPQTECLQFYAFRQCHRA